MFSFSSSAVNKSGKKFVPRAPVRRARPVPVSGSTAVPPVQPPLQEDLAVTQQTSTLFNDERVAGPVVASPENTSLTAERLVSSAVPLEAKISADGSGFRKNTTQSDRAATVIIPQPRRKLSIHVPAKQTESIAAPPYSTTLSQSTSATRETGPITSPQGTRKINEQTDVESREESAISIRSTRFDRTEEDIAEIRSAKRTKTSSELLTDSHATQLIGHHAITPTAPPTQESTSLKEAVEIGEAALHTVTDESQRVVKRKARKCASTNDPERTKGVRRAKLPRKLPRTRRRRELTPEGAEDAEITTTTVKMSDLCKDLRTGKISKREAELRNLEISEAEQKQKAEQEGSDKEQTSVKQNEDAPTPVAESADAHGAKVQSGPVMRIVNGEIVLDAASLQVDRHADADRNAGELEDVVENPLTRKINQSSYGKRTKAESWDDEATDLFYRGLRMFGTDFMMISKLFPGRSRRQIKLKFNNEERRSPERIKQTLLGPSETVDIETYSEMTNSVYDDPKIIQQELDEDKKRIEDQHAKEKEVQDEMLRNPGGTGAGPSDADTAADARFRGKRNKRQPAKSIGGGTEEVVGTIDDFS